MFIAGNASVVVVVVDKVRQMSALMVVILCMMLPFSELIFPVLTTLFTKCMKRKLFWVS
jgi:hypothetical protein